MVTSEKIKKNKTFWERLRNSVATTILGGLVVILPLALFIYILRVGFLFISNFLAFLPLRQFLNLPDQTREWVIDLIAFGMMLGIFFFVGLFVRTSFGRQFWVILENRFFIPLPFYGVVRDTVQQFFGRKDRTPFSEVVIVDVFGNDTRMIGFVSDELVDDKYSIFVPTGPNPTNGFIFIVAKHQLEWLDIRPDEAMRTIIGVGTGASLLFDPALRELKEQEGEEV